MISKERNISASQLVMALVVSRLFTILTYTPNAQEIPVEFAIVTVPISAVILLLAFIPYFIMQNRTGLSLLDSCSSVCKAFGMVADSCFCFFCLMVSCHAISHFSFFMDSTIYPTAQPWIFVICLTAVAVYGACLGLEAIARMSTFVFAIAIALIVLIVFSLFSQMNFSYIISPFSNGIGAIMRGSGRAAAAFTDAALFLLFVPRIGEKRGRCCVWWVIISAVLYEVLVIMTSTVLREYSQSRLFPLHTLAATVQIPSIGRVDLAYLFLWGFVAFIRASLYLYGACVCLRRLFKKLTLGGAGIICTFIVGLGAMFFSWYGWIWELIEEVLATGIPLAVLMLVFPLIALIFQDRNTGTITKKMGDKNA